MPHSSKRDSSPVPGLHTFVRHLDAAISWRHLITPVNRLAGLWILHIYGSLSSFSAHQCRITGVCTLPWGSLASDPFNTGAPSHRRYLGLIMDSSRPVPQQPKQAEPLRRTGAMCTVQRVHLGQVLRARNLHAEAEPVLFVVTDLN
jgi:hypothetical protein